MKTLKSPIFSSLSQDRNSSGAHRWLCWPLLLENPFLGFLVLLLFGTAASSSGATLTVTSSADSGPGSLRQAIADARPGDTIDFDSSVTGTITLFAQFVIDIRASPSPAQGRR